MSQGQQEVEVDHQGPGDGWLEPQRAVQVRLAGLSHQDGGDGRHLSGFLGEQVCATEFHNCRKRLIPEPNESVRTRHLASIDGRSSCIFRESLVSASEEVEVGVFDGSGLVVTFQLPGSLRTWEHGKLDTVTMLSFSTLLMRDVVVLHKESQRTSAGFLRVFGKVQGEQLKLHVLQAEDVAYFQFEVAKDLLRLFIQNVDQEQVRVVVEMDSSTGELRQLSKFCPAKKVLGASEKYVIIKIRDRDDGTEERQVSSIRLVTVQFCGNVVWLIFFI